MHPNQVWIEQPNVRRAIMLNFAAGEISLQLFGAGRAGGDRVGLGEQRVVVVLEVDQQGCRRLLARTYVVLGIIWEQQKRFRIQQRGPCRLAWLRQVSMALRCHRRFAGYFSPHTCHILRSNHDFRAPQAA